MKNLLGGKGANLAEMSNLGLPVPPGFTITTEVCTPTTPRAVLSGRADGRRSRRARQIGRLTGKSSATRRTRCWSRCAPAPAPRCRA
jgi:hypothetical protein